MSAAHHPNVHWVIYSQPAPGVFACACQICNQHARGLSGAQMNAFAAAHFQAHQPAPQPPAPRSHYGLGDLVAKATGALGIAPCTPCEARKRALNNAFPRAWRR